MSLTLRRLAPGVESQDLGDALMCVLGDALYYDAALTLGVLGSQGALGQALQALATTIFAARKSGKMRHYTAPREKKVLILGLVALMGLPDAQLPAEVKPGMPQVTSAVLRLLLALKQQQEEHKGQGSSEGNSGNESDLEEESEDGEESVDLGDSDDEVDEAYLRRLQRMAAKRAAGNDEDDDDDDSEDDEYWTEDEEEEVSSPIDAVDPFIFFAETLHTIQHSDPQRFAGLVGGLDANVQAAVQGMMQYAAELRQEQLQKAAAAAANGQAG